MSEITEKPTEVKPVPSGLWGKLIELWSFSKDHVMILLFCGIALAAFIFVPQMKEFSYSILRAFIVVFFVAVIVYIWFRETIRPYLVSGTFVEDFKALEGKHRVMVTVTILIAVMWLIVQCIVNA